MGRKKVGSLTEGHVKKVRRLKVKGRGNGQDNDLIRDFEG
jgi:hypothetical protein